jgi:hypothetical protein
LGRTLGQRGGVRKPTLTSGFPGFHTIATRFWHQEKQRIGYYYCGEDIGVFGIHGSDPEVAVRLDNIFLSADGLANFDILAIERYGANPDDVFFQGLAYRMMWFIQWDHQRECLIFNFGGLRGEYDNPTVWHLALLNAYNEVETMMQEREILADKSDHLFVIVKNQGEAATPAGVIRGIVFFVDGQLVAWPDDSTA